MATLGPPPSMRHLFRVDGLPFPANAFWQDDRREFAKNSIHRHLVLTVSKRCTLCGTGLTKPYFSAIRLSDLGTSPIWQPLHSEPFQPAVGFSKVNLTAVQKVFCSDGFMHRACVAYAFTVCPFLTDSDYRFQNNQIFDDSGSPRVGEVTGPKVIVKGMTGDVRVLPVEGVGVQTQTAIGGRGAVLRYTEAAIAEVAARGSEEPDVLPDPFVELLINADDCDVALVSTRLFDVLTDAGVALASLCPCESGDLYGDCHAAQAHVEIRRQLSAAIEPSASWFNRKSTRL